MNFMNPRFLKKLAFVAAVTLALTVTAAGAGGVGYVDDRRLFENAPQGKDEIAQLEAEFSERKRDIKGLFDLFKAKEADLVKNHELLSEQERADKSRDLQELQRQLKRAQEQYQEDYARRRDQSLGRLEKIITAAIIEVAKQKKLDLVLQQVVYANPDIDLTDQVLNELKKRHKK